MSTNTHARQSTIARLTESIDAFVRNVAFDNSPVAKGNAFSKWVLTNTLELREDEVHGATDVAGKGDNGVDAMFEGDDAFYVVQTKYGTSHSLDSMLRFKDDCSRLLQDVPIAARAELGTKCATLRTKYALRERIRCIYVTSTPFSSFEGIRAKEASTEFGTNSQHVSLEYWDINSIGDIIDENTGRLPRDFRGKTFNLFIGHYFETDDAVVSSVRLRDFASLVREAGNGLFHSNIRNFLHKTPINKGIKNTLQMEPDRFWFYNNGVTIVCDEYKITKGVLSISEPQVVNGCQTARSVSDYFSERTPGELSPSEMNALLLVRVIRTKRGANENAKKILRDSITRYTNSQNAVKGLDFYALDNFQRELQRMFADIGYYYEIQRGAAAVDPKVKSASGVAAYRYLLDKKFDNVLRAKEVIQAFAAGVRQRPNVAYSRPAELTPMGEKWSEIVNEGTQSLPIEFFLYPLLVLYYAKIHLGYKAGADDHRKSAALLFTSAYFTAATILAEKVTGKSYDEPVKLPTDFLRKIFSTKDVNIQLLKLVDRALDRYFDDSYIQEQVGDDLNGFLKIIVREKPWSELKRRLTLAVEKDKDLIKGVENLLT